MIQKPNAFCPQERWHMVLRLRCQSGCVASSASSTNGIDGSLSALFTPTGLELLDSGSSIVSCWMFGTLRVRFSSPMLSRPPPTRSISSFRHTSAMLTCKVIRRLEKVTQTSITYVESVCLRGLLLCSHYSPTMVIYCWYWKWTHCTVGKEWRGVEAWHVSSQWERWLRWRRCGQGLAERERPAQGGYRRMRTCWTGGWVLDSSYRWRQVCGRFVFLKQVYSIFK